MYTPNTEPKKVYSRLELSKLQPSQIKAVEEISHDEFEVIGYLDSESDIHEFSKSTYPEKQGRTMRFL